MRELRSRRKNLQKLSTAKLNANEKHPRKDPMPNPKNQEPTRRSSRLNPKPPTPPTSPTRSPPTTPKATPAPKKTHSDLEQFYTNLDNPLALVFQ